MFVHSHPIVPMLNCLRCCFCSDQMADSKGTRPLFDGPKLIVHSFVYPNKPPSPSVGTPVVLLHHMDYDGCVHIDDDRVVGMITHVDDEKGTTITFKQTAEPILRLLAAGFISSCADLACDVSTGRPIWVSLRFKVKRRHRWFACV